MRKKGTSDKRNAFYEVCNKTGHNKDTCFKVHGVPNWYKDLVKQRKKSGTGTRGDMANEARAPDKPMMAGANLVADLMEALKIVQGKMPQTSVKVHYAQIDEMADNGSEFLSLSCQSLLQNLGIIHQKSCTYTPQQNGVVERKHRHLLQVARAIMFEFGLPRIFWADSILVAIHIINKLPSSKLNWKTPFELLYKAPPSYAYLKTFGCLRYATNVMPHKSKFDHRTFKCVFIGYMTGQKGYKVYDIDNKVVFVSRNIVFHEDTFPYKSSSVPTDNSLLTPILSPYIPETPATPPEISASPSQST
ncbi:UNVERIFIED_CONTAM: putative mitochondrial protein [Sesamum radiatum]|uniref:Mitochondrial protein n=1 Tax=Sesamum radiatum TaxID=300843 RepID=A0AAW2VZ54_SESRA